MVLNDVAQTCCGWESFNCVPTASYCVHTMAILRQLCTQDDRFTFLQRQKYVILRCIGQHYVLTRSFGAEHVRYTFISCSHSVHGTSSKLSINTAPSFSHIFTCVSSLIMRTQNQNVQRTWCATDQERNKT